MKPDEAELAVRCIHRQNRYAESLCQQLQDARAWAKLWKRAAKDARRWKLFRSLWHDTCADLFMVRRENQELRAENVRLRAALADASDRLHQLDVAMGHDVHLAFEVFVHLQNRVNAALSGGTDDD